MSNARSTAYERRKWLADTAAMIAVHERFFAELGQQNAHSKKLRHFMRTVWDPFFAWWASLQGRISDVDVDVVAKLRAGLVDVRALALRERIPVPDLGGY
jgi:hypothetical protein